MEQQPHHLRAMFPPVSPAPLANGGMSLFGNPGAVDLHAALNNIPKTYSATTRSSIGVINNSAASLNPAVQPQLHGGVTNQELGIWDLRGHGGVVTNRLTSAAPTTSTTMTFSPMPGLLLPPSPQIPIPPQVASLLSSAPLPAMLPPPPPPAIPPEQQRSFGGSVLNPYMGSQSMHPMQALVSSRTSSPSGDSRCASPMAAGPNNNNGLIPVAPYGPPFGLGSSPVVFSAAEEGNVQSKYSQLLAVIQEMSRDIRPAYAGSKSSIERLKRDLVQARTLVKESLVEIDNAAKIPGDP